MKKALIKACRDARKDNKFDDWRSRYDASIEAYEAMSERRRERKLLKMAQAKRDEDLHVEGEIERRWLETHPSVDPIDLYFQRHTELIAVAWQFLTWSVTTTGNVVTASAAVRLMRHIATESINHVERLLWRTRKRVELSADGRSGPERERRKIRRRSTTSKMPSPDDIRKAWLKADSSVRNIIAFGAKIHDLECYVDNSLAFDEYGSIVGREAGILGWIRENVPELSPRYKTIMRYKSIAKRCRQYLGIVDPKPLNPANPRLATLLVDCPATQKDICARLDAALNDDLTARQTSSTATQHRR